MIRNLATCLTDVTHAPRFIFAISPGTRIGAAARRSHARGASRPRFGSRASSASGSLGTRTRPAGAAQRCGQRLLSTQAAACQLPRMTAACTAATSSGSAIGPAASARRSRSPAVNPEPCRRRCASTRQRVEQ